MDIQSTLRLRAADTLADAALYSVNDRGGTSGSPVRQAGLRCGRPLCYPVPIEDLAAPLAGRARAGYRYYGALFAFDLDEPADDGRYEALRLEIVLTDPAVLAVRVDADGDALGVVPDGTGSAATSAVAVHTVRASAARPGWLRRLFSSPNRSRAWVGGAQSREMTWNYRDSRGDLLLAGNYAVHALIEVPGSLTVLAGTIDLHATIAPNRRGRDSVPAGLPAGITFAEPLPSSGETVPVAAAVRLCFAADVEGYSRQSNVVAERTQARLVDVLRRARCEAGLDESAVHRQPQGDEEFDILPPGIDESFVIPRLVGGLSAALADVNRDLAGSARLRLRVAMHRGLVKEASSGWVGNAAVAVHRILNSSPLRRLLKESTDAHFALGLPDVLFQDVVAHSYGTLRADLFEEVTVSIPDKGFVERAWLYRDEPR